MVPFNRFTVVLDACTLFPMLVRDALLTLADHELFNPKWSPRIRDEWTRNLIARLRTREPDSDPSLKVARIASTVDRAFPDACVSPQIAEAENLTMVDAKDRHVVMTAVAAQADAIVTYNLSDFAAPYLREFLQIEVIHPDDFVMDLVDLNEKRAVAAFRELRGRKKRPPWSTSELVVRLREAGLVQTSLWIAADDVAALI
jgi:predicted nucleic acid-binding protein